MGAISLSKGNKKYIKELIKNIRKYEENMYIVL